MSLRQSSEGLPVWAIPGAAHPAVQLNRAGKYIIALCVFLGGFVINEPAPYELLLMATMVVFLMMGLRLSKISILLATLFILFNIGGLISMMQMPVYKEAPKYLAVSFFLALSSVFFAALIESDMRRLRVIYRAYIVGALVTAILGIVGYFDLFPGSRIFTLYDRAKGAFQDPNVFGPFLILPTLYLIYGTLYRKMEHAPLRIGMLLILLLAILLSFSRAAWGLLLLSGFILYLTLLIAERNQLARLRLAMVGIVGTVGLVLLLIIALQFDTVGNMFAERAQAVQSYDGGEFGRFARHAVGFAWAMERPLGMGPLEFGLTLGADPHNIWVKSLMAYGWLGFASYLTMTIFTLFGGGRLLRLKRPWQPYLQCAYAAFLGHIIIAYVIDIDHWRHVYLIIGIIWGCMALEIRHGAKNNQLPVQAY